MTKLLYSSSFDSAVNVSMQLVEDPALLTKSASTIFGCDYSGLAPDKDHVGIHVVALGEFEKYGCFFAGANVTTPQGQVAIENIRVGDRVLTHTGKYQRVLETFASDYSGDRVSLDICALPAPLVCTANHPVLVVRRAGLSPTSRFKLRAKGELQDELEQRAATADWAPACDIKPGDYLVIPTEPPASEKEGIELPPEEYDPYVCGFYLAEGCLVKEYRPLRTQGLYKSVMLTCGVGDSLSLDYIDAWLTRLGRSPVCRAESYTSEFGVRYQFGFNKFARWLDRVFGHDATTKRLGAEVWGWTREERLQFLAGYFDGDGCLQYGDNRYTGTLTASTASVSLALDLQRLLASVGVPSSVNEGTNRVADGCFGHKDFPIYSLAVGAFYSNEILAYTLRHTPHNRQFSQHGAACMQLAHHYALVPVTKVSVDVVENTRRYNLEVEEDNSYVVQVSTHNSNRNFDGFPRQACIKYHPTFVKNGAVFRHHRNKDRDKNLGAIKSSAYNERMGRIELFIHANKERARDELARLEKEGEIPFSMACKVAFDRCDVCNTKRKNASDPNQCDHIKYEFGKLYDNGKVACTQNDEPCFFDISFVGRPADRIAWDLKVASGEAIDSIKMAEYEDLWVPDHVAISSADGQAKLELLKKVAEMQRRYVGWLTKQASMHSPDDLYFFELRKAAGAPLSDASISALREIEPRDAFHKLARAGILLDAVSFFKYALGPQFEEVSDTLTEAAAAVPAVVEAAVKNGSCQLICNDVRFDVVKDERARFSSQVKVAGAPIVGPQRDERIIEETVFGDRHKFAVDLSREMVLNRPEIVGLAEKYAAYEVAALHAILDFHADTDIGANAESITAIAAAQNMML